MRSRTTLEASALYGESKVGCREARDHVCTFKSSLLHYRSPAGSPHPEQPAKGLQGGVGVGNAALPGPPTRFDGARTHSFALPRRTHPAPLRPGADEGYSCSCNALFRASGEAFEEPAKRNERSRVEGGSHRLRPHRQGRDFTCLGGSRDSARNCHGRATA
uniref:Uncharacterized protein n=1 Tax=Sphaerodactylus townsendi TaxID=933632 RepID=A0ACB8G1A1_9SAUR